MFTRLLSPLVLLACIGAMPAVQAQSCQMPSGKTWKNELKSEMTVSIDGAGLVSGTYTTAVGCGAGRARPLTGICNGYAVSFTVNWQECASVTAWSGTYSSGSISTLWHLVLAKQPSWDSTIAGADTFILKDTSSEK